MINWTSFMNDAVLAKVYAAVQEAKKTGLPQYVQNRDGRPFVRVTYRDGVVELYTGNKNHTRNALKAVRQQIKNRNIR